MDAQAPDDVPKLVHVGVVDAGDQGPDVALGQFLFRRGEPDLLGVVRPVRGMPLLDVGNFVVHGVCV